MNEYIVDATKISNTGVFTCPKCGALLDPDDETDSVYTVLSYSEASKEVLLKCLRCGSTIRIVEDSEKTQKEPAKNGTTMEKVKVEKRE